MDLKEANNYAKEFLLVGTKIKCGDCSTLLKTTIDSINHILEVNKKTIKEAVADYSRDDDVDAFMLALFPIHYRILYEAYAPYWLSHCKPVDDRDSEAEFTYYNDLIDMYWAWKWQEWKHKGEYGVAVMLPPTKGLMAFAYREEIEGLEEYRRVYCRRKERPIDTL